MSRKAKDPNPIGFKEYFGTAAMGLTDGLSAALITSFFLI